MRYRILLIDKPGGSLNPYTRIERVFVTSPLADIIPNFPGRWLSVHQVILELASGTSFFCSDLRGNSVEVKPYFYSVRRQFNGLLPSAKTYQLMLRSDLA